MSDSMTAYMSERNQAAESAPDERLMEAVGDCRSHPILNASGQLAPRMMPSSQELLEIRRFAPDAEHGHKARHPTVPEPRRPP